VNKIPVYICLLILTGCDILTASKSEPKEEIVTPVSQPSNFETNDSSYLKISIHDEAIEIQFLNSTSILNNLNTLDSFLQKNQARLDKDKILVTGSDTSAKFKSFFDLLSKYGISKVRTNSK